MSNATFSRKPLVAAVLTTLAVFSAGAMAEPVNKDVTLIVGTGANTVPNTIKDEKTWDEDWAKTFNKNFTNASGKVTIEGQNSDKITISKDEANKTAGKLTNKLSSLTLNVGLDVAEGGTFVNNGTLEANKAITVTGSLVNTGTLKIKDNLTINGLNKTDDLEAAPASVVMGDITLKNATLTNNDKGYKLKTEAEKKEGEADKKPETRTRVSYGNVTLNEGGNFVNAEGALDSGSSLIITEKAGTAQIKGKSTWGTINAQKGKAVTVDATGTLSADNLEYGYEAGENASIGDLVTVTGEGQFTVNKGLTVGSFASGGSFDLSKDKNKYLASGASLIFGKAQAFEQGEDGKIVADGNYNQGGVTLSDYKAVWEKETATSKTGTEGNADTENQGSWDVTKFGAVTVYNNAQLTISDNKAKTADDLTKHGYSASLSLGSLTLNSTSLKVTPSVKVEKLEDFIETALTKVNDGITDNDKKITLDTSKWTKDDYARNLENFLGTLNEKQLEAFQKSYGESIKSETDKLVIGETTVNAVQTITGSDVAIGSITFATVERPIEADTSKVVTRREGEGDNTSVDRGSVTVDAITQAMGTQTLKIEGNSRVEVGSLSLGNGTLNIKGSDVIIHKTDKINGTLTAESGYLGLNVATTMADKVKADTTTTGTTPNFVLEVGAPVVFGEDAKVTFGGVATTKTADTNPDAQAPKYGAQLTFAGDTTLKFDAANFNRNALFTADGLKGQITAGQDVEVTLDGANLTWGAYKLFENFKQGDALKDKLVKGELTAADAWKNQVGDHFEIKQNSEGDWMIVAGGTSVEGSGLNVSAKNLVSKIFAGERSTGPDTQLINQILSTGPRSRRSAA